MVDVADSSSSKQGKNLMLTIIEHAKRSYVPRTTHNAETGHVTIAFAVDFTTPGEKLTKKVAGEERLLESPMELDPVDAARELYKKLLKTDGRVLNIAGNGIATMKKHGWDQRRVDAHIYAVLSKVHQHRKIELVVTGGQTGGDIGGAIASVALDIETIVTMPNGLRQIHEDGVDRNHTEEQIREQIETGVAALKGDQEDAPRRRRDPLPPIQF
jgi:hypothetical protein